MNSLQLISAMDVVILTALTSDKSDKFHIQEHHTLTHDQEAGPHTNACC
jgi:hypothetical protein